MSLRYALIGISIMVVGLILIYYAVSWLSYISESEITVSLQGWFLIFATATVGCFSLLAGVTLFLKAHKMEEVRD